ncbi:MAG: biopolymer transporter ExbD [Rikenellaceae bacterium]|nr:biopolymer transporter ExbD [Rikenellaceae bacterium]MCL2692551.1 biopolymer transporter ExbD [Rikenellaceae bacterium]
MANKRDLPPINAGALADISFLLLIFFLVTTTMVSDRGLSRILPPWEEEKNEMDVKERNVLSVFINLRNEIMVGGERMELTELKDRAKIFIQNRYDDPNLPEKEITEIELIGEFPVSSGIVSVLSDRGTSYGMYIAVQNELTRAFNEIRDEVSFRFFGRPYTDPGLTNAQRIAVQQAVPLKISEAEQRDMAGGQ